MNEAAREKNRGRNSSQNSYRSDAAVRGGNGSSKGSTLSSGGDGKVVGRSRGGNTPRCSRGGTAVSGNGGIRRDFHAAKGVSG